jgi:hypothetical protein
MTKSIFEDTNPRHLKELLGQIHSRDAALPDFQRDFVWDPAATQELIVSIASNFPAGSLLRIRNTHNLFACREVQGAPALNGAKPTYLVLDGQQRLTSLYQAFYGVGEHRYYLDIRRLVRGDHLEDCFLHLRTNSADAKKLDQLATQFTELIVPLSVLQGGAGQFVSWIFQVCQSIKDSDERVALQTQLIQVQQECIQTIDDYQFPVVTLSDSTGAEAVCTIFETLNRTGVKLSPFELLTARFWPSGVNLRALWAKAVHDYPMIDDFEVDPYYLLQVVSLLSHDPPNCQRGNVLALTAASINHWWDRAVVGVMRALELLRDDCGVAVPKWLPYNTILIPLAAVLAQTAAKGTPQVAATRQKLRQWFWCSVFGQTYEKAANTQAVKDTVELLAWVAGKSVPESVTSFRFDPTVLRDTTPRQRSIYRGVFCLLLSRGPRDFHSGSKIDGDIIRVKRVDDHHVFPQAYLNKQGVSERLRDCVLNRTLIDRDTDIRISSNPPASYMAAIRHALKSDETFRALLRSHMLPADEESPFWTNDFSGFLDRRQEAIWQAIQDETALVLPDQPSTGTTLAAASAPMERSVAADTSLLVRRVLTRLPVPSGQMQLYRALAAHQGEYLTRSRLASLMQRTPSELDGVLGALGLRVNGTEEVTGNPGIGLLLDYVPKSQSGGEWTYRMKPELLEVLLELGLIDG